MRRRQTELPLPGNSGPSLLEHKIHRNMYLIEAFENKIMECGKHGQATQTTTTTGTHTHTSESRREKIVVRVRLTRTGGRDTQLKVQFHCICRAAPLVCGVVGTPCEHGLACSGSQALAAGLTVGGVQTLTNKFRTRSWDCRLIPRLQL